MQSKPPAALTPLTVSYSKKARRLDLFTGVQKQLMERNGLEETKAKEDSEDRKVGSTVTAGESLLPSVLQWRH